jgi:7-cyano-7-deazaguanine synthase
MNANTAGHPDVGPSPPPLAVLVSGGLDSAILLGEALRRLPARTVHPLYIRTGLLWEPTELQFLQRYLDALAPLTTPPPRPTEQQDSDSSQVLLRGIEALGIPFTLRAMQGSKLEPLCILDMPVGDLYGQHWSLTGEDVPGADTPDEAVFLPGRNVLLLSKALLWCHLHGVSAVALGTLGGNPFPDATPAFFDGFARLVSEAVGGAVQVQRPFQQLSKVEVMRRGRGLPLEWTFSCIRPVGGNHCGRCNKCAERQRAFRDAGLPDPTEYRQE